MRPRRFSSRPDDRAGRIHPTQHPAADASTIGVRYAARGSLKAQAPSSSTPTMVETPGSSIVTP